MQNFTFTAVAGKECGPGGGLNKVFVEWNRKGFISSERLHGGVA